MPTSCRHCGGTGQLRQMSQSFFGQSVVVKECPVCNGSGDVIENPCKTCDGNGIQRKTVEIKVKVPAGVAEGNYMTPKKQGKKVRKKLGKLLGKNVKKPWEKNVKKPQ